LSAEDLRVAAWFCRWCAATAADAAGTSRMKQDPRVVPQRIPCTGALDPLVVLRALVDGADGVLVVGCHPGDCHYLHGNYRARRRLTVLRTVLETFDLQPERLRLRWAGASEPARLVDVVNRAAADAEALGPSAARGLSPAAPPRSNGGKKRRATKKD